MRRVRRLRRSRPATRTPRSRRSMRTAPTPLPPSRRSIARRARSAPRNPTSRSRRTCAPTAGSCASKVPATLGDVYALRATVAYKGTWVRTIRTVVRNDSAGLLAKAAAQFAAAVAALPKLDKLRALDWFLVESARSAQPLEAVAGTAVPHALDVAPGALERFKPPSSSTARRSSRAPPALGGAFIVAPTF